MLSEVKAMLKREKLDNMIKSNNGILKISEVDGDISRTYLFDYIKQRGLKKISKGIYASRDMWEDTMYLMQLRYKQIIFSHETALYLLDMAEHEPLKYTVTVRAHYHAQSLVEQGVKIYKVKDELYDMGVTTVQTPMGNTVRCYNIERTLCDLVRCGDNADKQDFTAAIKSYMRIREKNIPLLMRYAKQLRVEKEMRRYTEVLL